MMILLIFTHVMIGLLGCIVGLLWCWILAAKTLYPKGSNPKVVDNATEPEK